MMEYTLGELIDRLCITNLKMWHIEEELNKDSLDMETKGKLCDDIVRLNNLRNNCIQSIDEYYKRMVK